MIPKKDPKKGNIVGLVRDGFTIPCEVLGFAYRHGEIECILLDTMGKPHLAFPFSCWLPGECSTNGHVPLPVEHIPEALAQILGQKRRLDVKHLVAELRANGRKTIQEPSPGRGRLEPGDVPDKISTRQGELTGDMTRYLMHAIATADDQGQYLRRINALLAILSRQNAKAAKAWVLMYQQELAKDDAARFLKVTPARVLDLFDEACAFLFSRIQRREFV